MPVTFEQLKQVIIRSEENYLFDYHENDGQDSAPYIEEMKEEISDCKSLSQLVDWYGMSGFDDSEAYEKILKILMNASSLTT